MKELILIRHAKSSWKDSSLDDRERPLNKRGERDAPEMGARLGAAQAQAEFDRVEPGGAGAGNGAHHRQEARVPAQGIAVEDRLYGAGVAELLDVIRNTDESVTTLMLFGHNPGLTELANHLGPRPIPNLPTCGVLHLRFETETWSVVGYARGDELLFDFPKT